MWGYVHNAQRTSTQNVFFQKKDGKAQEVFVQQKFDGNRQMVTYTQGKLVRIHNKNDTDTNFENEEALKEITQSLSSIAETFSNFVLDTELVALQNDKEDLYSVMKVKKKIAASRPKYELIVFDLCTGNQEFDSQPYRKRYEFLQRFLPFNSRHKTPGAPGNSKAQPVCLVRNLATWNTQTQSEVCVELGKFVIQNFMEGVVFRGCDAAFASRLPGSNGRHHPSVGMKLKPENLLEFNEGIARLLACGVSNSGQLVVCAPIPGVPTYVRAGALFDGIRTAFVGKAQPIAGSKCIPLLWTSDRHYVRPPVYPTETPNQPRDWFLYGSQNGEQPAQTWFGRPFVVNVKCDYRLSTQGLLQYAFACGAPTYAGEGVQSTSDMASRCDASDTLQDSMVKRALECFTRKTRQNVVVAKRAREGNVTYAGRKNPYPPLKGTYQEWNGLAGTQLKTAILERLSELQRSSWDTAVVGNKLRTSSTGDTGRLEYIRSRKQPWNETPDDYRRLAIEVREDAYGQDTQEDIEDLVRAHGGVVWRKDARFSLAATKGRRIVVTDTRNPTDEGEEMFRSRKWFQNWLNSD
jgi:hypothetical protein